MTLTGEPKISIVVPVYNVEKYLRQCLDSIVAQTLKEIEIIIVNDGSTDGSRAIIEEYAAKDKRIKAIHKANSGYGASMNVGFAAATGEYIGIVESDDWIDADMFANLYALAHENNVDVVKSNYYLYWSKPAEKNVMAKAMPEKDVNKVIFPLKEQAIFWNAPAIWSAIYRREFILKNEIMFLETAGASYQDTAFNFKVWASAERAYLSDKAYLHYRQDNEQSSVKSVGKVYCVCDEYHEIEKFVAARHQDEQLGKLVQRLKYGTYMWNLGRLAFPLNWKFIKVMSKEFQTASKQGLLDKQMFGRKPYRNVKMAAKHPYLFMFKQQIKNIKSKAKTIKFNSVIGI